MTENSTDILISAIGIGLLILVILILLAKFLLAVYMPFSESRAYIQMEIMRTHGSEREHWKRELRRLYISQIPFFGRFLVKRSKRKNNPR